MYLLGTCADVKEAVGAAAAVRVGAVIQKNMGFVPPCHYIVHDAAGQCVVLEYIDGELKVHDDPLGVVTNSPTFDWHVTNLRNYVNLSVTNVPPVELAGIKFLGLGQGSGMLGLPGDFTPPSRFVRAVAFSRRPCPWQRPAKASCKRSIILNQFDIPKGAARGDGTRQGGRRLHALDRRLGPEEPALLLPHVCQQPHPHDRPAEDGPRRQADQDDLDGRRRSHRGPVGRGEVVLLIGIGPISDCFSPTSSPRVFLALLPV